MKYNEYIIQLLKDIPPLKDDETGLDNITTGYLELMKKGGKSKIHIKPENKGKFTATKKATGKTTEELTHSKNPLTRKRAIFAQNSAKWNKK